MDDIFNYYRKADEHYCIDMKVDSLEQIFNPYDPSEGKKRALNHNLVREIMQQFLIFPKNEKLKMVFHMPKKYSKYEEDIKSAFKRYFELKHLDSHLHMKRRFRKAKHILFAATVLFVGLMGSSFILDHYMPEHWIWKLLSEGLFVGSWVSMWYPIHLILYDWIPLNEDKNNYKKLSSIKVEFVYN